VAGGLVVGGSVVDDVGGVVVIGWSAAPGAAFVDGVGVVDSVVDATVAPLLVDAGAD
jgi:hypothetical protein